MAPLENTDAFIKEYAEAAKRLANALGAFCIDFALVEKFINWGIAVLVPLEPQSKADLVLGPITSLTARLDIFSSLVQGTKMADADRDELLGLISEARELTAYRNWLLHGTWSGWYPAEDLWGKHRTLTNKKLKRQWKEISARNIDVERARCQPLAVKISHTLKRIRP